MIDPEALGDQADGAHHRVVSPEPVRARVHSERLEIRWVELRDLVPDRPEDLGERVPGVRVEQEPE